MKIVKLKIVKFCDDEPCVWPSFRRSRPDRTSPESLPDIKYYNALARSYSSLFPVQ